MFVLLLIFVMGTLLGALFEFHLRGLFHSLLLTSVFRQSTVLLLHARRRPSAASAHSALNARDSSFAAA